MKLEELILIADKGYPDGKIKEAFDLIKIEPFLSDIEEKIGDTLALFIAREISETFDPELESNSQLFNAVRVLSIAVYEIQGVQRELLKDYRRA